MPIKAPRSTPRQLQRRIREEDPVRRRFSVDEYYRMAQAGLFQGQRVELVDGEVLRTSPQGSPHATAVSLITHLITGLLDKNYSARVQVPLALGDDTEPEPDFAVVRGSPRQYAHSHPSTASLIIEVSDTTLHYDRTIKSGIYARAGVAEYWILDLGHRRLEICREPMVLPGKRGGHGYKVRSKHGEDEKVSPVFAPEIEISVADLLP